MNYNDITPINFIWIIIVILLITAIVVFIDFLNKRDELLWVWLTLLGFTSILCIFIV
jgi:hypothetical protein